jgi:hypothetical protein
MSRRHTGPVIRICLSPTQTATATGLSYERVIRPAIERGELVVYVVAGKRKVMVEDIAAYLRSHKQLIAKKR